MAAPRRRGTSTDQQARDRPQLGVALGHDVRIGSAAVSR
jgi:hypothetical protein